jgi:hypothetical protein
VPASLLAHFPLPGEPPRQGGEKEASNSTTGHVALPHARVSPPVSVPAAREHWEEERGLLGLAELVFLAIYRRQEFTALGLTPPRGILLSGPPGVGKSWTAQVVADYFRIPLLRIDAGSVAAAGVGETEAALRRAFAQARALSLARAAAASTPDHPDCATSTGTSPQAEEEGDVDPTTTPSIPSEVLGAPVLLMLDEVRETSVNWC